MSDGADRPELEWWSETLDGAPRLPWPWGGTGRTDLLRPGWATVSGRPHQSQPDLLDVVVATAALLFRHGIGEDVVVGLGTDRGTLLPLRIAVLENDALFAIGERVADALRKAAAHGTLDLAALNRRLSDGLGPVEAPVFQAAVCATGHPLISDEVHTGRGAPTGLIIELASARNGHIIICHFATDAFDQPTVEQWVGQLTALTALVGSSPLTCLADLDLLGEDERHRLLVEFNDTAIDRPPGARWCPRFAEQARLAPERRGGGRWGASLSPIGELDERSGRLARHLVDLGVHRGIGSGCSATARSISWWRWSGSCGPGRPTCRSTRATRPIGSPSCWRTPRCRRWSPRSPWTASCPASRPRWSGSTPTGPIVGTARARPPVESGAARATWPM